MLDFYLSYLNSFNFFELSNDSFFDFFDKDFIYFFIFFCYFVYCKKDNSLDSNIDFENASLFFEDSFFSYDFFSYLPWDSVSHGISGRMFGLLELEYPEQTSFLASLLLLPLFFMIVIVLINFREVEAIKEYSLLSSLIIFFL